MPTTRIYNGELVIYILTMIWCSLPNYYLFKLLIFAQTSSWCVIQVCLMIVNVAALANK